MHTFHQLGKKYSFQKHLIGIPLKDRYFQNQKKNILIKRNRKMNQCIFSFKGLYSVMSTIGDMIDEVKGEKLKVIFNQHLTIRFIFTILQRK